MNNMTEKRVKDGHEGRRTQMHLTITIIGSSLMLLGSVCFIIKANSIEYVDANGILHANFYLLVFTGAIATLLLGLALYRFRRENK